MSKTITSAEYNAWLEHPLTKALKRSFEQSITDPENQPSQYGTVTLEMYEALEDQLAKAEQRVAEYNELIYAVQTKNPDETRHQTALRYIRNAENRPSNTAANGASS